VPFAATSNYTLSLAAAGNITATRNLNSLRYTGNAQTLTIGSGFNLNTYGILQAGTGTFTVAAAGTGALSTPTGGGPLFLITGGAFGLTVSAPINDNGGPVTLVISGSDTVILSSTTSNYSGGTVVNAGTLSIGSDLNLGAASGGLTFDGPSTLNFTAPTALAATRAVTLNNGAIVSVGLGNFADSIAGNITGTGGFTFSGISTLTFSGTGNTYSGPTRLINIILKAGAVNAFGSGSAVTLSTFSPGSGLDITGFDTAIGSLSGGSATSGNVILDSATLTVGSNNESTTFAGILSGSAGYLTKVGTGTLTLTGINTYTGDTSFNGGLISVSSLSNLTTASNSLNFGGGGIQWAVGSSFDPSVRTTRFDVGGATFDTNTNVVAFANPVGNFLSGGLTKLGVGTLILQAANTYTGATTVNGGVLKLQNATAISSSSGVIVGSSSGALVLQGGFNFGSAPLTLNGNGFRTFQTGALVNASGANTYGGALSLGSSSTISVDNGSLNLSSTAAVTGSGFTLTLGGAGNGTLAGGLQTGTGGLTKTGTGTWTLTGAGTYSGDTTINGGKLVVDLTLNPTGVLGSASNLFINGSDLTIISPGNQTIASLNLGAGVNSRIFIDPNGGATTLTITGPAWTRGTGATVLFDYSSLSTGTRTATVTNIPTGTGGATGINKVLGYAQVKDSAGTTGMAYIDGSNNISRFDSATLAATLTETSDSATTDFTTLNTVYTSGRLDWTGIPSGNLTTRAVNSLTFDTTNAGGTVHMGALGNVLTLTGGAIQFIDGGGSNSSILAGGQMGANNSEVIVHQNRTGTGTLTIVSPISSGTGSLVKDGTGTLVLAPVVASNGTLNGTITISGLSSTANLSVGQSVSGGGIPAGATVASIVNGTTITISTPATAVMTSPLTFGVGNVYGGSTLINGGSLKAGSLNAFSANSDFGLANTAGAALDLNGFDQTIKSFSGGGVSGGNVILGGGATLTVGGPNVISNISNLGTRTTFGGQISGSGNLTLVGGGTLTLTNNTSTYTGQTNVNAGTLVISHMGQLGATSLVAVNGIATTQGLPGGTLVVQGGNGATGLTFDRNLTLSGRGNNDVGEREAISNLCPASRPPLSQERCARGKAEIGDPSTALPAGPASASLRMPVRDARWYTKRIGRAVPAIPDAQQRRT
jgi:autotransporter-associated beta strand protein